MVSGSASIGAGHSQGSQHFIVAMHGGDWGVSQDVLSCWGHELGTQVPKNKDHPHPPNSTPISNTELGNIRTFLFVLFCF